MLNIYFDDDKRNFADWTKEKVYKALYNLVTYMNENPGSKDNISICYSFDYLMSVYFYLNGILDHYSNASFIVNFVKNKGIGPLEILEDYLTNGIEGNKVNRINSLTYNLEIYRELDNLISENSKRNCSRISELVSYLLTYDKELYEMYDEIDEVIIGIIKWKDFYKKYKEYKFKEELTAEDKEYLYFFEKLKEIGEEDTK